MVDSAGYALADSIYAFGALFIASTRWHAVEFFRIALMYLLVYVSNDVVHWSNF